jgi:hypothetical protein
LFDFALSSELPMPEIPGRGSKGVPAHSPSTARANTLRLQKSRIDLPVHDRWKSGDQMRSWFKRDIDESQE